MSVPTVNEHLKSLYVDEEIESGATLREFRIVQIEGSRSVTRSVDHYNLEAIFAVGIGCVRLAVLSLRQWASARLSELLTKGFTTDDERIKAGR
ncbi:MAG: virulence RhuM family protein [Coriobacteriia bacterium]|nr:virulence RhuM family protein [Coriobacteriia bacterium]